MTIKTLNRILTSNPSIFSPNLTNANSSGIFLNDFQEAIPRNSNNNVNATSTKRVKIIYATTPGKIPHERPSKLNDNIIVDALPGKWKNKAIIISRNSTLTQQQNYIQSPRRSTRTKKTSMPSFSYVSPSKRNRARSPNSPSKKSHNSSIYPTTTTSRTATNVNTSPLHPPPPKQIHKPICLSTPTHLAMNMKPPSSMMKPQTTIYLPPLPLVNQSKSSNSSQNTNQKYKTHSKSPFPDNTYSTQQNKNATTLLQMKQEHTSCIVTTLFALSAMIAMLALVVYYSNTDKPLSSTTHTLPSKTGGGKLEREFD